MSKRKIVVLHEILFLGAALALTFAGYPALAIVVACAVYVGRMVAIAGGAR